MRKFINLLLFLIIITIVCSPTILSFDLFNYDKISLIFSYDMFENWHGFSSSRVYYQCFSTYFLFHKKIFIYGAQFILPFKFPINDNNTILQPQLNIIFGFESNESENMFIFQSGFAVGLLYVYINIPSDNFNLSKFYITYDFFLSVGVKINEYINIKFIGRFTYPIQWNLPLYYLLKPYYCISLEWYL